MVWERGVAARARGRAKGRKRRAGRGVGKFNAVRRILILGCGGILRSSTNRGFGNGRGIKRRWKRRAGKGKSLGRSGRMGRWRMEARCKVRWLAYIRR